MKQKRLYMSDHCVFRQIRGYLGVENKLIMDEQRLFSTKRLPMSECRVFSCEYRLCIHTAMDTIQE